MASSNGSDDATPTRPLSIVVWGNSVAVLQGSARPSHSDGTYGERLRDHLWQRGVPSEVHIAARWFDFLVRARRRYETDIRSHAPDVLIVNFGVNELQPWLAPVWLLRHLMSEWDAATKTTRWYRARLAGPMWRRVRSYRRWAAPRVGTATWQTTPARFAATLRRAIDVARHEFAPLILVLDVPTPGAKLQYFLPGIDERHERYQATIAATVAAVDDRDVRLISVADLARDREDVLADDGIHLTAAGHKLLGERLASEIDSWLTRSC